MNPHAHQKVTARHLNRDAYLYIRQSTVRQVFENTESTRRQYSLRDRAVGLGWPRERVVVIDSDQGQSGGPNTDREGFKKLVAEVGMGHAGIVLGLEVSRLARNSTDWHRLLEICALTDTLILDEDGIYNPCEFNDRLLLGLKGAMSEAELHVLRARLRGGLLNKARRGELKVALPVGLVYDTNDRVVLDPDQQVQQSTRYLFRTFERTGSASATLKSFRQQELLFPRRLRKGPHKGDLVWGPLTHWRVLQVLHSPRYAGAFSFGRHHTHKRADGTVHVELLPQEEWIALLPDAHPGYIDWEQYQANQKTLLDNAQAHGHDRRKSPAREGPALLQGLVLCGMCGHRMTIRYHTRRGAECPDYVCQRKAIDTGTPACQTIPGAGIDEAIGNLLIETITPVTLEVALQVQQEFEARLDEADRLRCQHVEQVRHETDLARRRYMQVDPDNRLVADTLEADWNQQLRALSDAQDEYERKRIADHKLIGDEQRARILALATDFPRLWQDATTPQRERKRMVRLLVEDVTLVKKDEIEVDVRFRGGATNSFTLSIPPNAWQMRLTPAAVVAKIDSLLDNHTEGEIVRILNDRDFVSGEGKPFTRRMVQWLRRKYRIKNRYQRLREAGMLTLDELANLLNVCPQTAKTWRRSGLLNGHRYNARNECLFEHPGDDPPKKQQGLKGKLANRRRFPEVLLNEQDEVQCEA